MTVIHVELAREFRGEDVVLLAMDHPGVDAFLTPLRQAEEQGSSRLDHDGMTHEFVVEAGAADIELHDDRVVWRSSPRRHRLLSCHATSTSDLLKYHARRLRDLSCHSDRTNKRRDHRRRARRWSHNRQSRWCPEGAGLAPDLFEKPDDWSEMIPAATAVGDPFRPTMCQ